MYQHNHVFGNEAFSTLFTEGMPQRLAPDPWLQRWTHAEIDAGADIVVMHGAPLLHGVVAHLRQENAQRQIEWVIDPDLPMVRGDAMLLAQAFGNLLNNSVKYTRPREKAHIEIGWKINPVGGRTFYVHDNGVGFDLEKAHNLFVMFQRQHHSMDFEGNGTGLALSQRIIERHGGRIWCESAPGRGCTFYFTLPFEGVDPTLDFTPSAMAALFSGLRIASTLAVIGVTVGELVGGNQGLGFLLVDAEGQGNTAGVFVAIVMLTLIGVLAYGAVVWAEKRVLHYLPKAMLSSQ